jgi:hypothetical protein
MDDARFDRITAALSGDGSTRRRLLGGVAGGGLAAAVASIFGVAGFNAMEAEAKKKKKRRRRRRKPAAQTISTNITGAVLGATCVTSGECAIGLICAGAAGNRTCQACAAGAGTCADATKCCALGVCTGVAGSEICVNL